MTLTQITLTTGNLDADVKINNYNDIISIHFDGDCNLIIGANGYNQDKLKVRTEIEVKSPFSKDPDIF